MTHYMKLFKRNYGIFSDDEQQKLRTAHILIIGCGGIGGTVAVMLARSGVSRFTLVDFDVYSLTNTNRQISCFTATIGRKKADSIKNDILRINPEATVTAYSEYLTHDQIACIIPTVDFVFPAADDFAFSLFVFRDARRLGKPALLVVPSGTWAHVSVITPESPSPEDIEGVPQLATYEELRNTLEIRRYKFGTYFYVPIADWRIDYYRAFVEEGLPPAQICPTVWISSALGAFEIVKYLTGKWNPVTSPRYWNITRDKITINRMNGLCLHTLLVWQRKVMWHLFQTRLAPLQKTVQTTWWKIWHRWWKKKEERSVLHEHPSPEGRLTETGGTDYYNALFTRNSGIFDDFEQERIRQTRVAIIGDSGTGEVLASLLARCGIGKFIIAGEDTYKPSDMNRQIGCFNNTLGRNKLDIIHETLCAINPDIEVTPYHRLPSDDEMEEVLSGADIVIPAVDDLAYSILLFRTAKRLGIPAVLCIPSGTTGWVSVFDNTTPSIEDVFGIPKLAYDHLTRVMRTQEFRCAQYNYITAGDWRVDWFFDYFTGKRPLALICPVEWLIAGLATLETIKIISWKWHPLRAPRCWHPRRGKVSAGRFGYFVRTHRKLGWLLFGSRSGSRSHQLTHFVWKHFFAYQRRREQRRASQNVLKPR